MGSVVNVRKLLLLNRVFFFYLKFKINLIVPLKEYFYIVCCNWCSNLQRFINNVQNIISKIYLLIYKKQARRIQLAQVGSEDTPPPFIYIYIYQNCSEYAINFHIFINYSHNFHIFINFRNAFNLFLVSEYITLLYILIEILFLNSSIIFS